MGSANEIQIIVLQKAFQNISSENIRDPSLILTPPLSIYHRIRPQQIAQHTMVRNFIRPLNFVYIVDKLQVRRESPMHAKNFVIDQCSDGKIVKARRKFFPNLNIVPPLAFIVESINSVDCGGFVVSSKQKKIFRIFDFVSKQKTYGLDRLSSPIYIIAQKKIVGKGRLFTILEYTQEIEILPMNVSYYFERCLKFQQNGLIFKYLPRFSN